MIVVEKLKLNKFRAVSIPRNRNLFERVGGLKLPEMADGQTAFISNGVMEEIDNLEAQMIRESQIPIADKSIH